MGSLLEGGQFPEVGKLSRCWSSAGGLSGTSSAALFLFFPCALMRTIDVLIDECVTNEILTLWLTFHCFVLHRVNMLGDN